MSTTKLHYSFIPGLNKIKAGEVKDLRIQIKKILDIKTDRDYYQKRKDYVNIPAHHKIWIENLFSNYGINKKEIWNITDDNGNNIDI